MHRPSNPRTIIVTETDNHIETGEASCTRSGIDRRQFSYSYHIPERRSGWDRRRGFDRTDGWIRRRNGEHRREKSKLNK